MMDSFLLSLKLKSRSLSHNKKTYADTKGEKVDLSGEKECSQQRKVGPITGSHLTDPTGYHTYEEASLLPLHEA